MDLEVKTAMEKLKLLPVHNHPLLPFTRFHQGTCNGCSSFSDLDLYGGYICNELGCNIAFHSKCAESVPEINHYSHPNHPLKLVISSEQNCSLCGCSTKVGYSCLKCDFKLDLDCASKHIPSPPVDFRVHEHPLQLTNPAKIGLSLSEKKKCKVCDHQFYGTKSLYQCISCNFLYHVECVEFFPEGYHSSHSKHPLKCLMCEPPYCSDKKCLLCGQEFIRKLHHCDVCNFSICVICVINPPPIEVVSMTTHEHTLHIVPRIIKFTCNACGTLGDRSPYFCLQCNFMIHRECIDLPRVININRHDHRISYTSHLGHGNLACGVCRKYVDGFYGGYSCSKCPSYVVHSRCATRYDIWDHIELEGMPEEKEEMEPFQVIDDHTIRHFSHDHNLKLNRDGKVLQENILCEACVFQICDDPFYSCEQCDFILHETCANLRPKKRHVANNIPFTLEIDSSWRKSHCWFCQRSFTGFKYTSNNKTLDIRCGSFLEPFFHESHPHPLYYKYEGNDSNIGARPEDHSSYMLRCDECPFALNFWWAFLPKKVMNKRYDDHPIFLSYGENNVSSVYWCDVCETKLDPEKWFYTCHDCGITLHASCVVGDYSFHKPGSIVSSRNIDSFDKPRRSIESIVVANTCIQRPNCFDCGSRCVLPFIVKLSHPNIDIYLCSQSCSKDFFRKTIFK